MKYIYSLLVTICFVISSFAQNSDVNLALRMDGDDNNVRTGMCMLDGSWTLEAWIKGNDNSWKDLEVVIGGGEYSQFNITDNLPLVIDHGRLHNVGADLWSPDVLDDQWHHVALTGDDYKTCLYLDGNLVDKKDKRISVLPGAIGLNEGKPTTFGGFIDEVRIWKSALSIETIQNWMGKPIENTHPDFSALVGYYNFDDGFGDVSINWVGKGTQAYHLRNGRNEYYGKAPLAYTVVCDNPRFIKPIKKQSLFNAVVIPSEWDVDQGSVDDQILKLRIAVTGTEKPMSLKTLTLDLSHTTSLDDIDKIHVYYTGKTAKSNVKTELFGEGKKPKERMVFKSKKGFSLTPGINYFLVTADIAPKAASGNIVKISVPSFKLGKKSYKPECSEGVLNKHILENKVNNPNIVKVLQWNIWHAGIHVGLDGPNRIIDLIKASKADIITMQEGYGSQKRIKDSLGYYMQTPSLKDNLVLFSRYPIMQIPTKRTFNSNPGKISLPNGREILVNACWLRYAYRPEYTYCYQNTGCDPDGWVKEDSELGLKDIEDILASDTNPYIVDGETPTIIGGDFNSCSHLDWTKEAAPLHGGYGPVLFPISKFLLDKGYKDSFRYLNPNEIERPEGTFAVIYGHLQYSRIDFLYYKGSGIRPVSSKIIRSAAEIDDVWASDHAAVMTVFEIEPK